MSEKKRLTIEKINKVEKTATMKEVKKSSKNTKSGRPKDNDEKHRQNKPLGIYLSELQMKEVEKRAVADGYTAKDKAKWLKAIAITKNNDKVRIGQLKEQIEEKDKTIEMLRDVISIYKDKK